MKLIDRDETQIECCNCYWKGGESDKLDIRIDDDYLIFNQVCPNCKGEDFYLSTIPKEA